MLSKNEIEQIIYSTVDIVPPGEDSVFLGVFSLVDNPQTLHTVLSRITAYYDKLLSTLPLTLLQRIELQVQRPFTYDEYKTLFTTTKEQDFSKHRIFQTLLITTQSERQLFTSNPNRNDSYRAFVDMLEKWSEVHNPYINALIYGTHH